MVIGSLTFMVRLLEVLLTFPGSLYTVSLGVVMLYWLSVVVGALDLDALGGAEHGAEGVAKGVLEGISGKVEGVAGGDGLGDAHHDGEGLLAALGGVGLRKVPVTVRLSLVVIFGWLFSVFGLLALTNLGATGLVWRLGLFVATLLLAVRVSALVAKPLAPAFTTQEARRRDSLAGHEAEVSTGRLDARFGQVLVHDGGAGLLVEARYEGAVPLKRGDRVVIARWDESLHAALVEPLDRFAGVRIESDEGEAVEAKSSRDSAARAKK